VIGGHGGLHAAGRPWASPASRLARQLANMTGIAARRAAMFRQASSPSRGSRSTLSRTALIRPIGARTIRNGSFSWYQAS